MRQSHMLVIVACCLAVGAGGAAHAGAPTPDRREGDFVHVCQGGPNKAQPCTVATQETDCPKSECMLLTMSKPIKGTLTIIAHDSVTDWKNGGATNRALTVMLEVKAPDGSRQTLAATYQDLATPSNTPAAPADVISILMDEAALQTLSSAASGLRFVQAESTLSQQLQQLFGESGTPVIIATHDKRVESADHTGDGLATVLRFKVKLQFLELL